MPSIKKRGASWRAQVRLVGHPAASESFRTKAEAVAWALDLERRLRAGHAHVYSSDRIVRDLFERAEGSAVNRWEVIRLRLFGRDPLALERTSTLAAPHVAAWRDRRLQAVSGGTVRREMALMSRVFRLAVQEWHWLEVNPITHIRWPAENEERERRITPQEMATLHLVAGETVKTSTGRVIFTFEFAIETGMRAGEILALTWEHVHLNEAWLHIPRSKNGDRRDVALSPRALAILREVYAVNGTGRVFALSAGTRDALFRKIRRKAGLDDLHFHDSRHEAITRLSKKMDVLDLARMVGTRDIRRLMTYYDRHARELATQL